MLCCLLATASAAAAADDDDDDDDDDGGGGGVTASYLADDCRLVADARERRLRSTESRTCVINRTHSTFGDRAFAAAGPGLWNSLPPHLRDADLPYSRFRQSLKRFLFV